MSSAKTERLVNLTMALLATSRYMQKSEIFRKVAGYSGTQETKERMFERDKDDLRALGIEIEVASADPLFEDEPGYRIKPETYQMPIKSFTPTEIGILSTALGLWLDSSLEDIALGAVRRVNSTALLDPALEINSLRTLNFSAEGLLDVTKALANRSEIAFSYRKAGAAKSDNRRVHPLGLSAWKGEWYLVGEDLDRSDIRTFNFSRISSKIDISKKRDMYEIPSDFNIKDYLIMHNADGIEVRAKVKKAQAESLRAKALEIKNFDEEWDQISYQSESNSAALQEALWYCDSLIIEQPEELRSLVVESLEKVARSHG
jgi:proteasome accessory factor B